MSKEKRTEDRVSVLIQIIESIDFWLKEFKSANVPNSLGILIQTFATYELFFTAYMNNKFPSMDELRTEANDELEKHGRTRIPKPIYVPVWGKSVTEMLAEQAMLMTGPKLLMPGPGASFFGNMMITPKKTRREELEELSASDVRKLYYKAKNKELNRERIDYILEAEKEYK